MQDRLFKVRKNSGTRQVYCPDSFVSYELPRLCTENLLSETLAQFNTPYSENSVETGVNTGSVIATTSR